MRIPATRASVLGHSAKRNLAAEVADNIWPVEADPGELELALLNIAVNARDAMPRGGNHALHQLAPDIFAPELWQKTDTPNDRGDNSQRKTDNSPPGPR
jgi:hypothetical protein